MTSPVGSVSSLEVLREEHLRRLIRVSQQFNSTIDIHQLLPRVLDLVMETIEAEAGSLWLLDGEVLRCQLGRGPIAEVFTGLELPVGAGIVGDAVLSKSAILVDEVRDDPRFLHQLDEMTVEQRIALPHAAIRERQDANVSYTRPLRASACWGPLWLIRCNGRETGFAAESARSVLPAA